MNVDLVVRAVELSRRIKQDSEELKGLRDQIEVELRRERADRVRVPGAEVILCRQETYAWDAKALLKILKNGQLDRYLPRKPAAAALRALMESEVKTDVAFAKKVEPALTKRISWQVQIHEIDATEKE